MPLSNIKEVQAMQLPIEKLRPFESHPFQVKDDDEMNQLVWSVLTQGVLTPLVVRPLENGEYEVISGHRRLHACQKAGIEAVPALIYALDRDAAAIALVDSNLHREKILPSEKAFAYKLKMDAMSRQGQRTDLTSTQVGRKLEAADIVGQETGDSRNQVRRYIRLTNLIPELLEMVDQKQISFNPAVELSYLAPEEQEIFMQAMDEVQASPSLSQAQRLKKLAQEGNFTMDAAREIMNEVKKGDLERVTFRNEQLRKYFPRSYTTQQMQDTIIKLLDQWQKKKARDQER